MTTLARSIQIDRLLLRNGLQLEYAEQGRRGGPTLLLLHGITDSWRSFEPVMPWLPAHWHVIALSQRGHGRSGKPRSGYRTHDFAADAAAFVRALNLPPLIVVGHSMGAANAMRLAIDEPALVRGLVAAGAFSRFGDKPGLIEFVERDIAPLKDPVPRALAHGFQLDTLTQPVAPGLVETMVDESLRAPAHVWREAFNGLLRDDFASELQRIAAPTLLVRGERDAFVPAADTQHLQRTIARAQTVTYAGAGHAMHWEQPERFARDLVRFIEALGSKQPAT